jgi:hypothetical protein
MARFVCIRAEVEKRRAEVAMGGNYKNRILEIVVPFFFFFESDLFR